MRRENKRILDIITNTKLDLNVDRDDAFLKGKKKTKGKTRKQMDTEDTTERISEVLTDFPTIIENNFEGRVNGVPKCLEKNVELLLKRVTAKLGVPTTAMK